MPPVGLAFQGVSEGDKAVLKLPHVQQLLPRARDPPQVSGYFSWCSPCWGLVSFSDQGGRVAKSKELNTGCQREYRYWVQAPAHTSALPLPLRQASCQK